jgi:putative DNA primase/helicase
MNTELSNSEAQSVAANELARILSNAEMQTTFGIKQSTLAMKNKSVRTGEIAIFTKCPTKFRKHGDGRKAQWEPLADQGAAPTIAADEPACIQDSAHQTLPEALEESVAMPTINQVRRSVADNLRGFVDAMMAHGLTPPGTIEPGKMHRFPGEGKAHGNMAGWCKLFDDGVGGVFGDFSTGLSTYWQAERDTPFNQVERDAFKRQIAEAKAQRDADEKTRHAEAATKATAIWDAATPAPDDHPYLVRKGIKASGVRLSRGALVIPVRNRGNLLSLQFIGEDGGKKFLTDGQIAGGYFLIGTMDDATALCIAEGFATGATIHEATGYPVVVAFSAGKLLAVAQAMRANLPDLPLILCADDDVFTDGNPGMTKATEAARSIGGLLAMPDFGSDRPDGTKDFNDMAAHRGMDAVRQSISALAQTDNVSAVSPRITENPVFTGADEDLIRDTSDTENEMLSRKSLTENNTSDNNSALGADSPLTSIFCDVSDVSDVQPINGKDSSRYGTDTADVSDVSASLIPDVEHRPCFKLFENWHTPPDGKKMKPGVWFFGVKAGKSGSPPAAFQQFVCSPIKIDAVTFDGQENNFGRLLRIKNTLGRTREWAMPMELLRGAGDDLRGELLAMGVEIDPAAKNLLSTYLQSTPPKRRVNCALQVGWCGDSFVLPDTVIGAKAAGVIFQNGERSHDEHTIGGTLAGWQAGISDRAVGNPLLMLGLSASFAGPLLLLCNGESGGAHFVADSSTGKTTIIEASCATWGGAGYRRSWRATANGMEGAAAMFNDCLLALDEISECDPKEVGAIVYALGNGRGKQRASRSGSARSVTRWRCFVLSSGERTIGTTMMEGGHRTKAGQAVRLLDIPAARRFGAWDDLHGMASGTAFSDAIKRASVTHHGHAGRAFLEKLTRDKRDFCDYLERFKSLPEFSCTDNEGQAKRAAARFALMALAGELATEYGVTGWPEGAATDAAAECLKAWLSTRTKGNDERGQILDRVLGFIEKHGDSRFSNADATGSENQVRINRAGWWRDTHAGREYLFTKDGLREATKGFDFNRALDTLQEAEALPAPSANGERSKFVRINGLGSRFYIVLFDKLADKQRGDHGA